jgi:hypothetical protein
MTTNDLIRLVHVGRMPTIISRVKLLEYIGITGKLLCSVKIVFALTMTM